MLGEIFISTHADERPAVLWLGEDFVHTVRLKGTQRLDEPLESCAEQHLNCITRYLIDCRQIQICVDFSDSFQFCPQDRQCKV